MPLIQAIKERLQNAPSPLTSFNAFKNDYDLSAGINPDELNYFQVMFLHFANAYAKLQQHIKCVCSV